MTKKPPKGKSLAEVNPELAKEWHPTKNGELTPNNLHLQKTKKYWWKCNKGKDHEWEATISKRVLGRGCPACAGKTVVNSNCLATLNPEITREWHPTKNGELTPFDVLSGSNKKVWWKCDKGDDHEYASRISHRNNGSECPICSGRKVTISNCLATLNPEVTREWHPTKNGELTPFDVLSGSSKKVWWKCDKGDDHEWLSLIVNRTKGSGCPICSGHKATISNSLATLNPELTQEWHPTKNGSLTPNDVTLGSGKKIWWKCDRGNDHEWTSTITDRLRGQNCSICSGHKTVLSNSIYSTHPEICKEWHSTKNKNLKPKEFSQGSSKKVWWKCNKGDDHEWFVSINLRSRGYNCPVCSNQKTVISNCLATTNPNLSKEWHPTKNGQLTPFEVVSGSSQKVWWKCNKGDDHEWKASINSRNSGRGCSVCANLKIVKSNCLATTNPNLSKEWHPTKNGQLTPFEVVSGSSQKVWWKCNKGDDHEWKASINSRASKNSRTTNCPYCTLTPQSKQELTITFELIQFFNINPKGFKSRIQGRIMSIDIFIPEFNLGIEFDGSYWHKGKRELDKLKTEKLQDDGFKIMRIREEPLKVITEIDVISKTPFNPKTVTNEILIHIMNAYNLDTNKIQKIKKYLLKEEIQNEKGLDAYIEMILTEKAEKKNP